MTTTQDRVTVASKSGWLYQLWLSRGHLDFRRWPKDEESSGYPTHTIWLFNVAEFEIPLVIRKAFASYATAGEKVIQAAIKICSEARQNNAQ